MMAGAVSSAVCMLILGWAKEIAGIFFADPETVSTERFNERILEYMVDD
jgi:hypothetical protein